MTTPDPNLVAAAIAWKDGRQDEAFARLNDAYLTADSPEARQVLGALALDWAGHAMHTRES